jgi:hypothetical protein
MSKQTDIPGIGPTLNADIDELQDLLAAGRMPLIKLAETARTWCSPSTMARAYDLLVRLDALKDHLNKQRPT